MDLTSRTRFATLAIGSVAASLILWLSVSFWIDAWHQRTDARLLLRTETLNSALLLVTGNVSHARADAAYLPGHAAIAMPGTAHRTGGPVDASERIDHGLDDALDSILVMLDEPGHVDRSGHSAFVVHAEMDSLATARTSVAVEQVTLTGLLEELHTEPVGLDVISSMRRLIVNSGVMIERIHALQDALVIKPRRVLPSVSNLRQLQTDVRDLAEQAARIETVTNALSAIAMTSAANPLTLNERPTRRAAFGDDSSIEQEISRFRALRSAAELQLRAAQDRLALRRLEQRVAPSLLGELDALLGLPATASPVAKPDMLLHERAAKLTRRIGRAIAAESTNVVAHAHRRLAIDTLLIAACFWIALTSIGIINSINHQAWHDRVTGLPNRLRFEQLLTTALQRTQQKRTRLGVIVFDIDHFRAVNDDFGHASGDALLHLLAVRLKGELAPDACLSALGGDTFAAILPLIDATEDIVSVAERLRLACNARFNVEGVSLRITLSIGVSVADVADAGTTDHSSAQALLRHAEIAMRQAKDCGGDCSQVYDDEPAEQARERIRIERDLRRAVVGGELELHYQPKIGIRSARVEGLEALVRWNHAERGMVSPAAFIPIAERSGLINEIGSWVLDEGVRQTAAWQREGLENLHIAINVSAEQLVAVDFVDRVEGVLARHALPAQGLELEITESVGMLDLPTVIQALEHLRASGISIAIDDFGTDYSSLQHLEDLPLDTLKIDRAFIRRLEGTGEREPVASAIVFLAKTLDLSTVAEGVETEEQLDQVTSIGCDVVQGYYFSPPVRAAELPQVVRSIEARLASGKRRAA